MELEGGVLALTLECVWVSAVLPKGSLGSWEEWTCWRRCWRCAIQE